MHNNGFSHLVALDHLRTVSQAIEWLSYVPYVRGGFLPITNIKGLDNVERSVDFMPSSGIPYDPRNLITSVNDAEGVWQSGFFDKGSFTETLAGWAKNENRGSW